MTNDTTIDPRTRRYVLPTRILWTAGTLTNPDVLLVNNNGQALIQATDFARMKHDGNAPGIVLDFGRELHGALQIVTAASKDNKAYRVRLRFGESVSEAMNETNNDHAIKDMIVPIASMGSQEYGLTGFRFVRIDLIDEGAEITVMAVRAVSVMRDIPLVGRFNCSDARLNQIWQTGLDTVHLCMQDYIWDGIKRDRLVWIGDMHPEVSVITATFGADPIVPASLDWVRDHTPLPAWMNGIGAYSMWWILIQADWYLHSGDVAYLEEQRDYLTALLKQFVGCVADDGSMAVPGRQLLDWPTSPNPAAVQAGLHGLLAMALGAGAALCETLGEFDTAALSRDAARRLALGAPEPLVASKQASALLALTGLRDAKMVNDTVLSQNPLKGLSTFYGYYVLQARAAAGDYVGALDVIRNYWGAMLDLGATSFWEDFDLSWAEGAGRIDEMPSPDKIDVHMTYGDYCYKSLRHSLCHGWAAGPTAWLSEHVLGVKPLSPGCTRVRVAAHLGDLAWAEGAYPTPQGPVAVRHTRQPDGTVASEIDAPPRVEIVRA
ncbi:MAG TPA: alpha-L-rhamnosidase C-terminal domain-containing protein [Capsulimonadaceae bacterium]|jgi:hypothetical protein